MSRIKVGLALFIVSSLVGSAFLASEVQEEGDIAWNNRRAEALPNGSMEEAPDAYFEGYVQALVDMHYYEYKVVVIVKDRKVWLANLPKNQLIAKSIITFVKDVPGVKEVHVMNGVPPKELKDREDYVYRPEVGGVWFPQTTELFQPLIANPRQVNYSLGYRFGDKVIGDHTAAVSLGDDFPIYRWLEVFCWEGDLQLGIEAGVWSVFNLDVKGMNIAGGTELVNTDYYIGIPLTYAINRWSFRWRIYHISSHLGDEFLVNHPGFDRRNPSMESMDFFTSYQINDHIRVYIGPGWVMHSDRSFTYKHYYIEYGYEFRFFGNRFRKQKLYGTFFLAGHVENWQFQNMDFNGTYVLGYEISKLQGIGRKMRVFVEYHHGFSDEGQFQRRRTSFGAVKASWGF